jgi:hypothetical protein
LNIILNEGKEGYSLNTDKEILKEIEEAIGKSIQPIAEVKYDTFGVKFKGNAIVELGLYECCLTALLESFSQLKSLQNLCLGGNQILA